MNPRRAVLFAALAAALAAVWWVSEPRRADGPELVEPPARPAKRAAAPGAAAEGARGSGPRIPEAGPNLFPAHSWQPPQPPSPPPTTAASPSLPPPPPTAPPLPFAYVGRWQEGAQVVLFLSRGEQLFTVRAGEAVAQWRVDVITEDTVTFTYLPLDKQQTMRLKP